MVCNGVRVQPYGEVAQEDSLAITCTSLGKCMSLTGVNHANVLIKNPQLRERYVAQRYADHYGSVRRGAQPRGRGQLRVFQAKPGTPAARLQGHALRRDLSGVGEFLWDGNVREIVAALERSFAYLEQIVREYRA